MATKIRLARGGSKKRPHYSIVLADSRMPRDGRFLEKLGTYDPMLPKGDEKTRQNHRANIFERMFDLKDRPKKRGLTNQKLELSIRRLFLLRFYLLLFMWLLLLIVVLLVLMPVVPIRVSVLVLLRYDD